MRQTQRETVLDRSSNVSAGRQRICQAFIASQDVSRSGAMEPGRHQLWSRVVRGADRWEDRADHPCSLRLRHLWDSESFIGMSVGLPAKHAGSNYLIQLSAKFNIFIILCTLVSNNETRIVEWDTSAIKTMNKE